MSTCNPITVQPITAAQVLPLRSAVLRPNRPRRDAVLPGDEAHDTLHLGAFAGDEIVGVVSLYRQSSPAGVEDNSDGTAWQLRGMAVHPDARGRGYGRVLLEACINAVHARGGTLLWCNARTSAVEFYLKSGFATYGEEFVIPDVGPHYVMLRRVEMTR